MSSAIKLDRRTLARILQGDQQAIYAFEQLQSAVEVGLPSTIEEAQALAAQAQATAALALSMLAEVAAELARVSVAPAAAPLMDPDDHAPRVHLGTISSQNHDAVQVAGGTANLDAGTVAAPSLTLAGDSATGLYRSAQDVLDIAVAGTKLIELATQLVTLTGALTISKQLTVSVATGTSPLVITSTTKVANLYVDRAATADSLGTPGSYPADATDLATAITLVNYIKNRNTSKGV